MQLDPEYLRQHYASLSDEALLAVDRAELVEMAHVFCGDLRPFAHRTKPAGLRHKPA